MSSPTRPPSPAQHPLPISLAPDTLILVTNGTRPIPLQVTKQLLAHGARVRVTTPAGEDAGWLRELFAAHHARGAFEHVVLADGVPLGDRELYREAVRGVCGVVHSPTFPPAASRPDPDSDGVHAMWDEVAASVRGLLDAAHDEPRVEAVAFTSCMRAAASLRDPERWRVDEDAWNKRDVIRAMEGGCDAEAVRGSCLVTAEQAVWEWTMQRRGQFGFRVNVVCPSNVIGQNLGAKWTTEWRNWMWELYMHGKAAEVVVGGGAAQGHWYVSAEDAALVHIAAVLDPTLSNQRIFAWGCYRNWNNALAGFNAMDGNGTRWAMIADPDEGSRRHLDTDVMPVYEILRRWSRRSGWLPFEGTIFESVNMYREMGEMGFKGA